ncbi:MAG: AF1514 family protein [Gammaproteobacteria bacterium]|nr:AF1514 family protein [Gammaproteobacteria bacterium]
MTDRHFHLRLNCNYESEKNDVTDLLVEILLENEWKTLHLSVKSPGFLLLVYGLFSCQHLYMRTNSAERNLILQSATGELKLIAGEFWNIQSVDVAFNVILKSGQPVDDDIAYIIDRMGHCPVSTNLPSDLKIKSVVHFEQNIKPVAHFAESLITTDKAESGSFCNMDGPDFSNVETVELSPEPSPADYQVAMQIANRVADHKLENHMLLSWYDKDRDFESPQHASECHANSPLPGYVDYGVYHGATLKVDIEDGRFVFFYLPIDF